MTEDQIKHMVDRFLGWHLPENFSPDAGISYARLSYQKSADTMPSGTNLFDATQADAMVRYLVEGMPAPSVSEPGGREATDEQLDERLAKQEARDNLRLLDYIADKIGLPHNEELSRENFNAWFPTPSSLSEPAETGREEISKCWQTLEDYGFPPFSLDGELPNAIDCAIDCLVRQRQDLLAEVQKLRSAVAPADWQLVPKEPTKEMIQACIWALDRWREKHGNVQGFVPPGEKYQVRWRAMLEAAPSPTLARPGTVEEVARQKIIALIRDEYDPTPSYYKRGDNWDDGAERIADAIFALTAERKGEVE